VTTLPFLLAAAPHPLTGTAADWLWLLPLLPLLGFVLNGLIAAGSAFHAGPADPSSAPRGGDTPGDGHGDRHAGAHGDAHHAPTRHRFAAWSNVIGVGVMAAAFALAVAIFLAMRGAGEISAPFIQRYFSWMPVGDLQIDFAFQLDQLSMVMILVITGVGALIHLFAVGYMREDPGVPRFFAYLNLFVAFMLVLVLGASYPVLFVGWEGVGLCSYLLIGFWFSDQANADAGKKAFIVNRIGDVGFLIAIFMLWSNLHALDFAGVQAGAATLVPGGALVTTICLFFFLGCTGKSAQIPLYIWLPDAMAGPTPVSALIHAATMVTAGVYLIARSSFLFALAPVAGLTVAAVGGLTALFASTIALKQWDIKKVLAYSTVSQLGYMFVAVGVGAYAAGIFHLVTHAFFKALLFLGAGSIIHVMHAAYRHSGRHEEAQDMRNMGGLRGAMPVTFVLMWIATLAIAGIPLFAGFFSKDAILSSVLERAHGSTLADARWLGLPGSVVLLAVYAMGLTCSLLTAIYMARMMLYTFHGPNRTGEAERKVMHDAPWVMTGPLVVLAVLSAVGGWLNLPELFHTLGPVGLLDNWLEPVTGAATIAVGAAEAVPASEEMLLIGIAVAVAVTGMAIAFARLKPAALVAKAQAPEETGFGKVLENKYYVDEIYDRAVVEPVVDGSRVLLWKVVDKGFIDGLFVNGAALVARALGWVGSRLQTGQAGEYAWALVLGVLAVLGAFTLR
jgi:NADH-quinone oxidoreductase subunit L